MPEQPIPTWLCDRRAVLRRLALVGVVTPFAAILAGCADDSQVRGAAAGHGRGGMMDGGMGDMMDGGMMDGQMMPDMHVVHDLLLGHDKIRRQVEDIEGGIRSRTTSTDPRLAALIRVHVEAMASRVKDNRPIRHWDPLFREIFEHHAAITIALSALPDGVQVTETSTNPQVVLLIRQHAHRAVTEFVAQGMPRSMQPTPLPDAYRQ